MIEKTVGQMHSNRLKNAERGQTRRTEMEKKYVIGTDFGTDSVRALIADALTGDEIAVAVVEYPRWKQGKYCEPGIRQYRQHPLDYIEAFTEAVRRACDAAGAEKVMQIAAISVDTTGSTPCPADENGMPLALLPDFAEDPDAMFHLWKDHTAVKEAEEITRAFYTAEEDYTRFMGPYSSEWFWAKILHTVRKSDRIRKNAAVWVEHCDWMVNLLSGNTAPEVMYRCSCAAGHKAYWHSAWDGLPAKGVLAKLDPYLGQVHDSFLTPPESCARIVGTITHDWAQKLGLPTDVIVAGCSFDAHAGAVGAGVCPGTMVINIGTSAVNMLTERADNLRGAAFGYLAGQAEDSILPGYVGMETSQAAFGDTYAWLKKLLLWPVQTLLQNSDALNAEQKDALLREAEDNMLAMLQQEAQKLPVDGDLTALDWFNGRRYPHNNDAASGVISGLTLGTTAPQLYQALVEATAFGQKRIVSELLSYGVNIETIIAVGGIAQKSDYVMQVLCDVLEFPITVSPVQQACALGAAMYAAVAAGFYADVESAQRAMCRKGVRTYLPQAKNAPVYREKYRNYCELAARTDPAMA